MIMPLSVSRSRFGYASLLLAVILTIAAAAPASAQPSPERFFGFQLGTPGRLADWPEIVAYASAVADASDRVVIGDVGGTTDGNRIIAAFVSSPRNLQRLDEIQAANKRLANPRITDPTEAAALAAEQPVIVAIGCSIHSTEIGASQAASELLYELATADDAATLEVLDRVVLVLLPSLNPDGHRLVVDWHDRNRGTDHEASPMPWLYHEYVGHDINRDAFMLNMAENRSLAAFFYGRWHPQVFLSMHQMGSNGPRFFVPPNYAPLDPNYDPLIWREAGLLGQAMALELERAGRSGVVSNVLYDYYWPGYEDSAPLGHNTVCLLTEAASARLSYPVTVPASDLTGSWRGLPDYRPQTNFPNPWPGGVWTLRDIVEYDLSAARGLLTASARYRKDLVDNFYAMGRRAVEAGRAGSPFAFVIPREQHDPAAAAALTNLLVDGGVEVRRARLAFRAGEVEYPAGTDLILMAQPFRAYAKTLLERQAYPIRRLSPGGPPERPYDVAGWTLPLQMGVRVDTITDLFEPPALVRLMRAEVEAGSVEGLGDAALYIIDGAGNGGAIAVNRLRAAGLEPEWAVEAVTVGDRRFAAGAIVVPASEQAEPVVAQLARDLGLDVRGGAVSVSTRGVGAARIGLYKPWVSNIDEGWTRWLLEQHEFAFESLRDADIRAGNLNDRVDVLILPDAGLRQLRDGHPADRVPAEFTGGLGTPGVAALRQFVEDGGTLVALDSSTSLAISALDLPITNLVGDLSADEFYCPGSILALDLDAGHPLAFGMPTETAAFFASSAAFRLETDAGAGHAQVAARYGEGDPLLSGWLEGGERIAGQAALVDVAVADGRAVLIGFRAQHRAQSHATFRVFFNALLTAGR
ncbi:MAG: peptidase M14 [Acidobacteria bacterium]|nr:peptidase M14 [Acidobacteriota bacterium]